MPLIDDKMKSDTSLTLSQIKNTHAKLLIYITIEGCDISAYRA